MEKQAIICDLDGTLYDASDRQQKHLLSGKKDFDGFHRDAEHDSPHLWCVEILQAMKNKGFWIIFTSGRDDTYAVQTALWIRNHLNWNLGTYELHMRNAGDYTPDDVMKETWLLKDIGRRYDILFAIDDRKRVADMWRRNGIPCLHCSEGNF